MSRLGWSEGAPLSAAEKTPCFVIFTIILSKMRHLCVCTCVFVAGTESG